MFKQPKGPFCQSCGMPMTKPVDFAMAKEGFHINDYCRFCWVDGAFTNPAMTMQEMQDFCTKELVKQHMPEVKARALMAETLPRLKRWRTPALV